MSLKRNTNEESCLSTGSIYNIFKTILQKSQKSKQKTNCFIFDSNNLIASISPDDDTDISNYNIIEVISIDNYIATIKIGQLHPNAVAELRNYKNFATEEINKKEDQLFEVYTYCIIDFKTCIVSYVNLKGLNRVDLIEHLFKYFLSKKNIETSVAAIVPKDILPLILNKDLITKIDLSIAIPSNKILSDIGLDADKFLKCQNLKSTNINVNLTADTKKTILEKSLVETVINRICNINSVKKLSIYAKDSGEAVEKFDIFNYNFTKKIEYSFESDIPSKLIDVYNEYQKDILDIIQPVKD